GRGMCELNVRFSPKSRHRPMRRACPLGANMRDLAHPTVAYLWWSISDNAIRPSRASAMSAIVKNPRATTKRTATPYSCWRLKNAQTKAMITSSDVAIPLTVAYNIALFKTLARRFRRGMSAFRLALETSSSLIAFNACDLSMMRFMRAISTEMNAATAPSRNEGAVAWAMTWDSCVMEGDSKAICVGPRGFE